MSSSLLLRERRLPQAGCACSQRSQRFQQGRTGASAVRRSSTRLADAIPPRGERHQQYAWTVFKRLSVGNAVETPAVATMENRDRDRRSIELGDKPLEARIVAQRRIVGVVGHPVALAAALCKHPLEQIQRRLLAARHCLQAGSIHQGAGVVGVQLQRSPRPSHGALNIAAFEQRAGRQRQRPSVERIARQRPLGAEDARALGLLRSVFSPKRAQRQAEQERALEILLTKLSSNTIEFGRAGASPHAKLVLAKK